MLIKEGKGWAEKCCRNAEKKKKKNPKESVRSPFYLTAAHDINEAIAPIGAVTIMPAWRKGDREGRGRPKDINQSEEEGREGGTMRSLEEINKYGDAQSTPQVLSVSSIENTHGSFYPILG